MARSFNLCLRFPACISWWPALWSSDLPTQPCSCISHFLNNESLSLNLLQILFLWLYIFYMSCIVVGVRSTEVNNTNLPAVQSLHSSGSYIHGLIHAHTRISTWQSETSYSLLCRFICWHLDPNGALNALRKTDINLTIFLIIVLTWSNRHFYRFFLTLRKGHFFLHVFVTYCNKKVDGHNSLHL